MAQAAEVDFKKAGEYVQHLFGYLGGAVVSGMVYLGDELGIFRAMSRCGPVSSQDLAEVTGLQERWLREWLQCLASADVVDYRDGRFSLSPEAVLVLVDESTPFSAIGAFGDLPSQFGVLPRLPEAFRTGLGLTYDDQGAGGARGVERMFAPWYRHALVREAIPALDGVEEKLRAGANVADVGCGAGRALLIMGEAYPNAEFHGYDTSEHALARARQNLEESGLTNVHFHNPKDEPMPSEPTFDLVCTFDCLHDMPRPDIVAGYIRNAIKPDGTWFILDIESAPTFDEMRETNPGAAMFYGISVMSCMSSSMSEPGGLGLGTCGLPEPKMRELVTGAGFTKFNRVPGVEHPVNALYEARP